MDGTDNAATDTATTDNNAAEANFKQVFMWGL